MRARNVLQYKMILPFGAALMAVPAVSVPAAATTHTADPARPAPRVPCWAKYVVAPTGIGAGGSMYEGAYTSAAHGWSTGVLPALTNDLLGGTPTGVGFRTWTVVPHPGPVTWAKGRLPTPHGALDVSWRRAGKSFSLTVSAPKGTSGTISVPTSKGASVRIDGHAVTRSYSATTTDGYVTLHGIGAGSHTVTVTAAGR